MEALKRSQPSSCKATSLRHGGKKNDKKMSLLVGQMKKRLSRFGEILKIGRNAKKQEFHLPNNGEYAIIKELEGASRPKADCFVTARARSAQNRTVRKNFLGGVRRKPDGQTLADSNRRLAAFETNRRHDWLNVCLAKGGMAKHTQKWTRQNGSLGGGLFSWKSWGNNHSAIDHPLWMVNTLF